MKWVEDHSKSTPDIKTKFNFTRSPFNNWLNHLYGTKSLTTARKLISGEITREQMLQEKNQKGTLGRICYDETRKKISNSLKGRIITQETKKKMKDSHHAKFIEKYHLDELDFKNAVTKTTTLKMLQEKFNLPIHAVHNSLNWIFGTRSLNEVKNNLLIKKNRLKEDKEVEKENISNEEPHFGEKNFDKTEILDRSRPKEDVNNSIDELDEKWVQNTRVYFKNISKMMLELDDKRNEEKMELNSGHVKQMRKNISQELDSSSPVLIEKDGTVYNFNSTFIKNKITGKEAPNFTDRQNRINPRSYIYLIENKRNGKVYIGQTIRSPKERFDQLKSRSHRRNLPLHNALAKYPHDNFNVTKEITLINEPQYKLDLFEKYYIKKFKTLDREFGYNIAEGGMGGKQSIEVRKQIGETLKEYYKIHENPFKDKKHTTESKKVMSEKKTGKNNPHFG